MRSMIVDLTFPASAVGVSYEMASYPKSSYQGGVLLPNYREIVAKWVCFIFLGLDKPAPFPLS